jgi:hypothetical protein
MESGVLLPFAEEPRASSYPGQDESISHSYFLSSKKPLNTGLSSVSSKRYLCFRTLHRTNLN